MDSYCIQPYTQPGDLLFHHLSRLTYTGKDIQHFESCCFSGFINFSQLKLSMTTLLRAWLVSNTDLVETAHFERVSPSGSVEQCDQYWDPKQP